MKSIIVYFAPSCPFSAATITFLTVRGADFRCENVERGQRRSELQQALGDRKLETPTLEVGGDYFVAPKLSELKDRLTQWGLPSEVSPYHKIHD